MIKDRGNIKWSSLMLTEHRKKLEELLERDQDIKSPEIDEQQLQEMDSLLKEAVGKNKEVSVVYYGNRSLNTCQGKITDHNKSLNKIKIKDSDKTYNLRISNIIDLSLII